VNLWPDDVHSPFFPPEAKRGDGTKRALYHGVLETMDRQLGVLFEHVRRIPKLRDNTLILICSDNGPEPGAGSAGPLRAAKGTLSEGGIRSPLVVWGPGLIAADAVGQHNETSVFSAMDLVPSLLEVAHIESPDDVTFDGENIADTLRGRSSASRKAPLFWRRPPDRKFLGANRRPQPDLAVREGTWKLLCEYDGRAPKLYDLGQDPGETTNLADQHAEVVERLTAALVAWHRSMPPDKGDRYASVPVGAVSE
jgi:arylsulfatase A-like enzyme